MLAGYVNFLTPLPPGPEAGMTPEGFDAARREALPNEISATERAETPADSFGIRLDAQSLGDGEAAPAEPERTAPADADLIGAVGIPVADDRCVAGQAKNKDLIVTWIPHSIAVLIQ